MCNNVSSSCTLEYNEKEAMFLTIVSNTYSNIVVKRFLNMYFGQMCNNISSSCTLEHTETKAMFLPMGSNIYSNICKTFFMQYCFFVMKKLL